MNLDPHICYRAVRARDARFDGLFFTGVESTGIYCRPVCPAPTPRLKNCVFLPSAAAAHEAGFRPCLRCRPEVAPDAPGSLGGSRTMNRALALIAQGALDDGDGDQLAARVGVGERHLRRLFVRHLGASPSAVAEARRVLFAKKLLAETGLPITQVAYASGFRSLRRFNAVIRARCDRTPRELRRAARPGTTACDTVVTLELAFRPPLDWPAMLAYLAPRATPGVEWVSEDRYCRTIAMGEHHGVTSVRRAPGRDHLLATIGFPDVALLPAIVARLRDLFDLDASPVVIAEHLRRDPRLRPLVDSRPGLRVAGAWDGFELAVRAILGQQVSVKAATTLMGRLVATCGEELSASLAEPLADAPTHVFPSPETLAAADLGELGVPRTRARAIQALARVVADDHEFLTAHDDVDAAVRALCELPGIGPWTAQYVALRALHEPDAFPASDLGLRRALERDGQRPGGAEVARIAESWRPWRAYAAMHLWNAGAPVAPVALKETTS